MDQGDISFEQVIGRANDEAAYAEKNREEAEKVLNEIKRKEEKLDKQIAKFEERKSRELMKAAEKAAKQIAEVEEYAEIIKAELKATIEDAADRGRYYTKATWQKYWHLYEQSLHLSRHITPHYLRHTYCTTLYRSGIDVQVAQRLMGHARCSTTMDVYTHLSQEDVLAGSVDKLNDYISGMLT
jgi:site-specific recombinase XerD